MCYKIFHVGTEDEIKFQLKLIAKMISDIVALIFEKNSTLKLQKEMGCGFLSHV